MLQRFEADFNNSLNAHIWNKLWEQHNTADQTHGYPWPVFEIRDDIVMVCWFQKGMEISNWTPIQDPCPFTKRIIKSIPVKRNLDSVSDQPPSKRHKVEKSD